MEKAFRITILEGVELSKQCFNPAFDSFFAANTSTFPPFFVGFHTAIRSYVFIICDIRYKLRRSTQHRIKSLDPAPTENSWIEPVVTAFSWSG